MRSKSPETTERIKSFIFEYYRDFGRSPSVREVAKAAGISVSVAQKYLVWLRDNSEIEYNGRRGISSQSTDALVDNMVPVGIIGSISCGIPQTEEEYCEDYVRLPEKLVSLGDGMSELILVRDPGSLAAFAEIVNSVLSERFDSENLIILQTRSASFHFDRPVAWTRDGEAGGEYTDIALRNCPRAVKMIF